MEAQSAGIYGMSKIPMGNGISWLGRMVLSGLCSWVYNGFMTGLRQLADDPELGGWLQIVLENEAFSEVFSASP